MNREICNGFCNSILSFLLHFVCIVAKESSKSTPCNRIEGNVKTDFSDSLK